MLLTVISGSDDAAVKSRAQAVITEWLGPEYDTSNDLEIIRGDDETVAPEDSLNEFLASAMTPPFFGDGKTVWLRHWSGFKLLSESRSAKAAEARNAHAAKRTVFFIMTVSITRCRSPRPVWKTIPDGDGVPKRK